MDNYASYCGLYCGACPCKVATENGTLEDLAARLSQPVSELECHGCKMTETREDCEILICNRQKGFRNCSDCNDFPCHLITELAHDEQPHHASIIDNLHRIREIGLNEWLLEQKSRWSCPKCHTRSEWYQEVCKNCGQEEV